MEKVLNVTLCGFYLLQLRRIYCTKRFIELSWKENNVVAFGLGQFQPKMLGKMAKNCLNVVFLLKTFFPKDRF